MKRKDKIRVYVYGTAHGKTFLLPNFYAEALAYFKERP